ncbi:hypothetical protein Pint_11774 [Pistacia integerrima]|uniref:Uncharacterized protein n=1 Tax=Pistacia integerrima TaxID=434235 RepID=A0ACC0XMQ6_9ROSI|nr:hypothetical protein Pint_11774 [Pistacia integerrima]
MFQSAPPKHFWGEAILTATYIINRLPTPVLKWETPYEILFHKPPDYLFLRTFGCLCFATNTHPHNDKFAPRAYKCVFLGYNSGHKAYKMFDIQSKTVFMSRDAIFHEHSFPFKQNSPTSTTVSLPQIPITENHHYTPPNHTELPFPLLSPSSLNSFFIDSSPLPIIPPIHAVPRHQNHLLG